LSAARHWFSFPPPVGWCNFAEAQLLGQDAVQLARQAEIEDAPIAAAIVQVGRIDVLALSLCVSSSPIVGINQVVRQPGGVAPFQRCNFERQIGSGGLLTGQAILSQLGDP